MSELVVGLVEFQNALRELERSMQRKVLQQAAKAGADYAIGVLRTTAPRRSGDMAESIESRAGGRENDINEATVNIKPGKKGWYWFFTNSGTKYIAATHWFDRTMASIHPAIGNTVRNKMIEALRKAAKNG